jgi:hypothetical protein
MPNFQSDRRYSQDKVGTLLEFLQQTDDLDRPAWRKKTATSLGTPAPT